MRLNPRGEPLVFGDPFLISASSKPIARARIEYLKVQNFRALREVEFKDLTPLTVLLGPNGSGKSTVFDVFEFLAECFELGLRSAWDKRGRAKELKTRGGDRYPDQSKSNIASRIVRSSRITWPLTNAMARQWLSRNGCAGSAAATANRFGFSTIAKGTARP